MSYKVETNTELRCNGCSKVLACPGALSIKEIELRAVNVGWTVSQRGKIHYCKRCSTTRNKGDCRRCLKKRE